MYDWLSELPADGSVHVVTANRRLARALREVYAERQIAAGSKAWLSPEVRAVQDWYATLADKVDAKFARPIRINEQQSRILWEECLRAEIGDPYINIAVLARLCRGAWQRMHDWELPLARVRDAAASADQQLFARVALHYAKLLNERDLVDGALLPALLIGSIEARSLPVPAETWCCGFDRRPPRFQSLLAALAGQGSRIRHLNVDRHFLPRVHAYADPDAELRAAGAWARTELERDPNVRIGIVVTRLEQDAQRSADLIREGLVPGWQSSAPRVGEAIDLSYGRRLADFPAIHVALLVLRWLVQPLRGAEVALLLRTPYLGLSDTPGRTRLEMLLREWPDRDWRIETLLRALVARDDSPDAADWLDRFARARAGFLAAPRRAAPGSWAAHFEAALGTLAWPGQRSLSSRDFQLDNRWRRLLNEFARLEPVLPQAEARDAVARLSALAADSLYQPESPDAIVTLLGPLEAAGLEFDRIWLAGAVATEWPPSTRSTALIARDLQREFGMPDSTPDDTAEFARRVLRRILSSAPSAVLSYPSRIGDAVQAPTRLAGELRVEAGPGDPGWFAAHFAGGNLETTDDRVPPVITGERVAGGAYTIQRQAEEPFVAFARGRLGVRPLPAFASGIATNLRGNLIHGALAALYSGISDQADLRRWVAEERQRRIAAAVEHAFRFHERYADGVLLQLLSLERIRTMQLLHTVLDVDSRRPAFAVAGLEMRFDTVLGGAELQLRVDRIDRATDGSLIIIDYKTGQTKKLIDHDGLRDLQLVVYSCDRPEPVSGLAVFSVTARRTAIVGIGPAFDHTDEWASTLARWQGRVRLHASNLADGDVRVNLRQGLKDARDFGLISRYPEMYRGD